MVLPLEALGLLIGDIDRGEARAKVEAFLLVALCPGRVLRHEATVIDQIVEDGERCPGEKLVEEAVWHRDRPARGRGREEGEGRSARDRVERLLTRSSNWAPSSTEACNAPGPPR